MTPNNVVTQAGIDAQRISQTAVNAELAKVMGPAFVYPNLSEQEEAQAKLQTLLNDENDPRVKALRDAVLIAINTYVEHANDEKPAQHDATETQLYRFRFNQAIETYGQVRVDLLSAIQAIHVPDSEVTPSVRVDALLTALKVAVREEYFSPELLAQAKLTAEASKGVSIR